MISWPLALDLCVKAACCFLHLRPLLVAVLDEQVGVEGYAPFYLDFCFAAVCEANLIILVSYLLM
jgi:hypothetical protein